MQKDINYRIYELNDNNLIAGIVLSESEKKKCLEFIGKPEQELLNFLKNETVCKRIDLVEYSVDFRNTIFNISFLDNKFCHRISTDVFVVYECQEFKIVDITKAIEYLRGFLDDMVILKVLGVRG